MDIKKEIDGDTLVLSLGGEFDAVESDAFCSALDEAVGKGATKVVVDLAEVQFVDSSAIKCILNAERQLADRGGGLSVARPKAMVAKVFDRLQIARVIPVRDDLDSAREAIG